MRSTHASDLFNEHKKKRSTKELRAKFYNDRNRFDLMQYIIDKYDVSIINYNGRKCLEPCPLCGRYRDFFIETSKYSSRCSNPSCADVKENNNTSPGAVASNDMPSPNDIHTKIIYDKTIIDFLMASKDIDQSEAIDFFKFNIMGYDRKEWRTASLEDAKAAAAEISIENTHLVNKIIGVNRSIPAGWESLPFLDINLKKPNKIQSDTDRVAIAKEQPEDRSLDQYIDESVDYSFNITPKQLSEQVPEHNPDSLEHTLTQTEKNNSSLDSLIDSDIRMDAVNDSESSVYNNDDILSNAVSCQNNDPIASYLSWKEQNPDEYRSWKSRHK